MSLFDEFGEVYVDVNEQNEQAHRFYLSQGFKQVGRSELDDDGRPYPILNLCLKKEETAQRCSK